MSWKTPIMDNLKNYLDITPKIYNPYTKQDNIRNDAKSNSTTSQTKSKIGEGFERFVYDLYSDFGYDTKFNTRIRKGVIGDGDFNTSLNGQIDIIYNNFLMTKYVECKYRSNSNVNFDDYSKFETTLKTFDIPLKFGEIVTNQYFDSKVIARAKQCEITLIDGDMLRELSDSRINSYRIGILAYNFYECLKNTSIINAFNIYKTRFIPFENQIEFYIRNYDKK